VQIERKLRSFENRVLRTICGPVFDTEINRWRRRKNKEIREITKVPPITSYVKGKGTENSMLWTYNETRGNK